MKHDNLLIGSGTNIEESISFSNILLKEGEDFRLHFNSERVFSNKVNITYRSPRKIEGELSHTIVTTSIERDFLNNLRVEVIDGLVFVVNDAALNLPVKMCVVNERVGHEIINGIINADRNRDDSQSNSKSWLNRAVEEVAPAILLLCCISLAVSGTYFLGFR